MPQRRLRVIALGDPDPDLAGQDLGKLFGASALLRRDVLVRPEQVVNRPGIPGGS